MNNNDIEKQKDRNLVIAGVVAIVTYALIIWLARESKKYNNEHQHLEQATPTQVEKK